MSLSVQLFAEYPQFSRAHAVGGSRQSTAYSVGTDGAGNCFLAGSFGSTINVGSIDFGTTNFASSGGIDGFLAKFNSFGVCQWARRFSGAGRQEVFSVAVHSSGDCYVVGVIDSALSIGATTPPAHGSNDMFLARFDAAGDLQWAHCIGGAGNDYAYTVAVNSSDEAYVTGSFEQSVDFGEGIVQVSNGAGDGFLAKFSSNGSLAWVRTVAGAGEESGDDLSIDANGNCFLVGEFATSASFGTSSLTGPGLFVARYTPAGTLEWAMKAGEGNEATLPRVATCPDGSFYVSGQYSARYTIGSQVFSNGVDDIFLAKFGPDRVPQWAKSFGGNDLDAAVDIDCDQFGNPVMAGHFRGSIVMGTNTIVSRGLSDVFVAGLSSSGAVQWVRTGGGIGTDLALALALDGPNHIYLAGIIGSTATFGPFTLTPSDSFQKAFLARIETAPDLRISRDDPNLVVSWSSGVSNAVLQSTTDLTTGDWSEVSQTPSVQNGEFTITTPPSPSPRFFRLKTP